MAKKAKKTGRRGRPRASENGGKSTTVQLRREATAYLRELEDLIQEEMKEQELDVQLQPNQVVLIALKNEVARRKAAK